jgi:hypothetical protein
MSMRRTVRWRPLDAVGLEHCEIRETGWGYLAESVVIGSSEGSDFGCRYEVQLDRHWTFRHLLLERTDGRALILKSDGKGNWERSSGETLPEYEGAIDIDISITPFTNTLPLRRARLEPFAAQRFRMVFVPLDTLTPFLDEQIYERLDGHRFRYRAADGSFTAEIEVDADGLVTRYPPLFERLG